MTPRWRKPPGCCVRAAPRTSGRSRRWASTPASTSSRLRDSACSCPHLAEWIEARRGAAAAYLEAGLGDLAQIQGETTNAHSAWHILAVASDHRERIAAALADADIQARPYYEIPLYRQPALERWAPAEPLAETERICSGILALPMGAALPEGAPGEVVEAIDAALD